MDDHRRSLRQGFAWLGGGTALSRGIDVATTLILLTLLTKQQVGVASLVISFAMVVEALNGLGTSEALIQAPSVSRPQLDTVFWYVLAAAFVTGGVAVVAAPLVGLAYGIDGIAPYFLTVAAKQVFVGLALVPLAILTRELQFRRIASINVFATIAAALTRLALGALGAGAWALVIGYAASGFFTLIGAMLLHPFVPKQRPHFASIGPLTRFGLRAASANFAEQMFKNADYLLVAWFYGTANLAIYRVAFEVAMEPAVAIGTVVNRTALPVLSRLASDLQARAQVLTFLLSRIISLVAPLAAGLFLTADALTSLIHDELGHSYSAAAAPLRILAVAALLRMIAQIVSTALLALGRPDLAARLSAAVFVLLTGGIVIVGETMPAATGLTGAAAVWLGIYAFVVTWGVGFLHRNWSMSGRASLLALRMPIAVTATMIAATEILNLAVGLQRPAIQVACAGLMVAAAYATILLLEKRAGKSQP